MTLIMVNLLSIITFYLVVKTWLNH